MTAAPDSSARRPVRRVAVLGTGLMGAPMARRVLTAGFEVAAWNRSAVKAERLRADGARVAAGPAEAAREADVVLTMLENGKVVEEVLFARGAAEAARPGTVFLDMSSIPPESARDHAARLEALGHAHLDAPVSGGEVGAGAGTLAIMAGGDADVFARVRPLLEAMGRPTHVGPAGAGQLAKLANQVIVAVTIGAVSEALLLAAAGGADPEAVRTALRGGFAESRVLELHGARMLERNFVPGGAVKNQLKDLNTARDAATKAGIALPLLDLTRANFEALLKDGGGEYDHAALLLWLERMNAPARVGAGEDRLPG